MLVIHINATTQNHIADTYNNGVIPEYGVVDGVQTGEDNYYLVTDDDTPNKVVSCVEYWDWLHETNDKHLVIIKK